MRTASSAPSLFRSPPASPGATDIEVLTGLQPGQEIVIGPYKTLRTLKNGALLKKDTAAGTPTADS